MQRSGEDPYRARVTAAGSLLRARSAPSQSAPTPREARPGERLYECTRCGLRYYAAAAECPACLLQARLADRENRLAQVNRSLMSARNQLELLTQENQRLRAEVDVTEAMRECVPLIGPKDLTFIKSVLYRWRADKASLALKVTRPTPIEPLGSRGPNGQRVTGTANGFLVMVREHGSETHACTSIGGVVLASHYEQACRLGGSPYAMSALLRALSPLLVEGS